MEGEEGKPPAGSPVLDPILLLPSQCLPPGCRGRHSPDSIANRFAF